jgi:hypothetical protein
MGARRHSVWLVVLAGCLASADPNESSDTAAAARARSHIRVARDVSDELACRVGIVGSHCDRGGACELGLSCEYDGYGAARVCTKRCNLDGDCPLSARCIAAFPGRDGGVSAQGYCVRPCEVAADCSCAGSVCVPNKASAGSLCL